MFTHRFDKFPAIMTCDKCDKTFPLVCGDCLDDEPMRVVCEKCHKKNEDDLAIEDDETDSAGEKTWELNTDR